MDNFDVERLLSGLLPELSELASFCFLSIIKLTITFSKIIFQIVLIISKEIIYNTLSYFIKVKKME